ncbi:HNH endonuclease [Bacillus cereus]|uniref:HNH endonuclease n=1 Tax=Bacillus cereus TaxID=1396 RepID=UPI00115CDC48|nr:hypothetical protein [Bacillus cereus]
MESELELIMNSFDTFVSDFFEWIIIQNPQDSDAELAKKINEDDTSLGKVARRSLVQRLLISFVRCPERNLIYFLYLYYIKNYKNIIDGIPFLESKFSSGTLGLIESTFKYFYETLIDLKTFQINYIPNYTGPKKLKREIRKQFGYEKVCPYCDFHSISHEDYSSIDHFLPKSKFPLLAIHSKNLVISCAGCNDRIKLDRYELPVIHPLYEDVTMSIKFNFNQSIDKIEIEYIGKNVLEIKSAIAFTNLFKLKEVYNTVLYRLRADRKEIRDAVESNWMKIENPRKDYNMLKKLLDDEYNSFLIKNIKKRGYFGLTKLRIDFCDFLQEKGKEVDLEYLAGKLSIKIDNEVLLA